MFGGEPAIHRLKYLAAYNTYVETCCEVISTQSAETRPCIQSLNAPRPLSKDEPSFLVWDETGSTWHVGH
jgi:hypothetical protein